MEHGYDAGCHGCIPMQAGIGSRAGHTAACRKRTHEEFRKTPESHAKVEANEAKFEKFEKQKDAEGVEMQRTQTNDAMEGDTKEEPNESAQVEAMDDQDTALEEQPVVSTEKKEKDVDVDMSEEVELEQRPQARIDLRVEIPCAPIVRRDRGNHNDDDGGRRRTRGLGGLSGGHRGRSGSYGVAMASISSISCADDGRIDATGWQRCSQAKTK